MLKHERDHASAWEACVVSIAGKIGCAAHTLHEGVKKTKFDQEVAVADRTTTKVAAQLKPLE